MEVQRKDNFQLIGIGNKKNNNTEMVQEENEELEDDIENMVSNFFEVEETFCKIKIWGDR